MFCLQGINRKGKKGRKKKTKHIPNGVTEMRTGGLLESELGDGGALVPLRAEAGPVDTSRFLRPLKPNVTCVIIGRIGIGKICGS